MIYEYFRTTRAYEAVQGLTDLSSISLQIDDVQDFDVRWDHALLTVSEMPSLAILEGLYQSTLQNSVQPQTVLALYDQNVARNSGAPKYQQFNTAVKLHIDQMMRNRNFRIRSDVVERGSVTKCLKGNKACVESGRVFSVEAHGQCFNGDLCIVSVMTYSPVESRAKVRAKRTIVFSHTKFEDETD